MNELELLNKLELYRRMVEVRILEDELQKLCYQGEAGDLHFSKGQEAISVGVCSVLKPSDYMITHHRTIAHSIAKGVPLKPLVAEILGKASGVVGGIAGEMHIHYAPANYMFSFQLVGTCIPVAAGVAWASKYYKKEDNVTAVFFGDAATSNTQFHEGMNISSIKKLPLLIIVENNHLAGNIRPEFYLPPPADTQSLLNRFKSYEIPAISADGNKIDVVIKETKEAIKFIRKWSRPMALVFDTTRLGNHKQGQGDIRTKEEIKELSKRDPIEYWAKKIKLSESARKVIEESERGMILEAIEWAKKEQPPSILIPYD